MYPRWEIPPQLKHSIVVAKLTNTISSYPQEGTILNRPCCQQTNTVSDKTHLTQFRSNITGNIYILCRSMSGVELPMRFESAHSVPNIFKLLHFVTSLLIPVTASTCGTQKTGEGEGDGEGEGNGEGE